ncbi:MAG: nucleotidyl transferase AbiEii/AbiGii toxin family protein [Bacteroidia bacterium]|nr:nucleotidyl transferase AbiEii/AbiGii toxin family protein [Bacteroidia bacterium]
MIPKPFIAKWKAHAPWNTFAQIEQDLVISRVLVEIFSDDFLRNRLAFRGGTAIHKLFLKPAPRYSEDIDLVQINPGPIKPIMQRLNEVITFFDQPRKTSLSGHGPKIYYRFLSEYENIPLRLKIEINCKEHFHFHDWMELPFEISSDWFQGKSIIRTFQINELLGTKLRAIYQRKKGRDLFDLDYAQQKCEIDPGEIVNCFYAYMQNSKIYIPTAREFEQNLLEKEMDLSFAGDLEGLLRPEISYNPEAAFEWLRKEIIPLLR